MKAKRALWRALGLALIVSAVEVAMGVALWSGEVDVFVAAELRFALCAILLIGAFVWSFDPGARSICLQVGLWTLVGGPFGVALAWMLIIFGRRKQREEESFGEWVDKQMEASIDSEYDTWRALTLDDRLRIEGASETQPLCDILDGDDQRAKLKALSVIHRRFDSAMIAPLRTALHDTDAAVRVMAASVLAKLQKEYGDQVVELQKEAEERPGDPVQWILLSHMHLAYVRSGLLSAERLRDEREKAREALRRAIALEPQEDQARLELGNLMIEMAMYREAFELLGQKYGDEFTLARASNLRAEAHSHLASQMRVREAARSVS